MAKICFFGGTFNPIHNGHIELAQKAVEQFSFDSFFFMPTGGSYMKNETLPAHIRYKMTEIAVKEFDGFNVTDIESCNPGPSYTFETLSRLNDIYPNDHIYFLMGEDSIRYIDKWKHPEIIFKMASIIVAKRIGNSFLDNDERPLENVISELSKTYDADIQVMEFDNPISSTTVRNLFKSGENEQVKKLISPELFQFIHENNLYV